MIALLIAYLLLVLVMPLALSATVAWRSIPRGRRCPNCRTETFRLRARLLRRFSRLAGHEVHWRWCSGCGWEGYCRVAPARPQPLRVRTVVSGKSAGGVTRIMDVRSLSVDGIAWRVRLECWGRTGTCWGRLVFVEPSGRLWLDVRPLRGRTDRDVLGQALSLPDDLLASRLRALVSD